MTFLAAVLILPLLMLALAGGCGLLVERVAGRRLPGLLVLPVGLALMVVLANLAITTGTTAELGTFAILAAAIAGFAFGGRALLARERRIEPWAAGAVAVTYLIGAAGVILVGEVTMTGYLVDGTVAIHLLGAEHMVHDGRDFSSLADSSARGALVTYFGDQEYPAGSMVLLGSLGRILGVDLAWLYQPLIATSVAIAALPLFELARRVGAHSWQAAGAAVLAASPALVVAYALMGAIKEMVVLPFLLALVPLVLDYAEHQRERSPLAAVAPLAVVGAAGVAAIGLAFGAWLGLALLVCLALALYGARVGRLTRRAVIVQAALLAGALALLCLPTLSGLADSLRLAGDLSQSNAALAADPGNLLRPLKLTQIFGIWLSGEHRVDPPDSFAQTQLLIGVAIVAFALGLGWLARAGRSLLLALLAGSALLLWLLTLRGTDWLDAKLLVLTSPLVVLVAVLGAVGLARGGRRVEATLLAAALAFGIVASSVMLIHATNIAPTDRLRELESIGERYAGDGPAYVSDFDEMALYFLRDLAPEGPGYAHRTARSLFLNYQQLPHYGDSYDTDQIPWPSMRQFTLVVRRRGPYSSSLPSGYERVFSGAYYEVWRRGDISRVKEHYGSAGGASPPVSRAARRCARSRLPRSPPATSCWWRSGPRRCGSIPPRRRSSPTSGRSSAAAAWRSAARG